MWNIVFLDPLVLRAKRTLDLALTVVGGILISPFFLALCLIIYLELRGHVFYKDQRMGRGGKSFSCIKFRTMVPDAEALLQRMVKENARMREEYSKYHKLRRDPRVTHVGRFLRKTGLDELLQIWNVQRGEISLVGPRPYLLQESGDIGAPQNEILHVPPRINGAVAGRRAHRELLQRQGPDGRSLREQLVALAGPRDPDPQRRDVCSPGGKLTESKPEELKGAHPRAASIQANI